MLIPLLGVGLGQPVSCIGASSTGQCLGTGGVTPATAFRIGTDGLNAPYSGDFAQTLPQPSYPGTNGTAAAGAASVLDPSFRPAATYNFNFSIQREIRPKMHHLKSVISAASSPTSGCSAISTPFPP